MDLSLKRHYGQKGEHRGRFGPSNCSSQAPQSSTTAPGSTVDLSLRRTDRFSYVAFINELDFHIEFIRSNALFAALSDYARRVCLTTS